MQDDVRANNVFHAFLVMCESILSARRNSKTPCTINKSWARIYHVDIKSRVYRIAKRVGGYLENIGGAELTFGVLPSIFYPDIDL